METPQEKAMGYFVVVIVVAIIVSVLISVFAGLVVSRPVMMP
jgi:preprotein translocase subunit SecE